MENLCFISKGEMYEFRNGKSEKIECMAIKNYREVLKDIKKRNEWKQKNNKQDMMTMIMMMQQQNNYHKIAVSGIARVGDSLAYSAVLDNLATICIKSTDKEDKIESMVIRKDDIGIFEIAYSKELEKFIVSASNESRRKHIATVDRKTSDFNFVTEGDCVDSRPIISKDNKYIYFDSCGLGFDEHENIVGFSPKSIMRLNMESGELDEILSDDKFDFMRPRFDNVGNLYCIKRPYKEKIKNEMNLMDIVLFFPRLFKAFFGWLNIFSKSYGGSSLVTKDEDDSNPVKTKKKTQEEIFIEGNLINVEENTKKNRNLGEKFPGSIPRSWELVKFENGETKTIKSSVLSYEFTKEDEIIISNGKYLFSKNGNDEKMICEASLVTEILI